MSEIVIKTHDFELAKRGLQDFSQKKAKELEIDTVSTSGGFLGLGNHKVTGIEFNNRLSSIQQHLIDLNTTNNRTIKEFGQVYSALEALDKDYIQAILISIKATEKTSERIQATQEQIKKIVDDQKKTLEVLKRFKQKLDSYAHLEDIDKIWCDSRKLYDELTTLSNSIRSVTTITKANAHKVEELKITSKNTEKKLDVLSNQVYQQIVKLEAIIAFTCELEKIAHLQDIDEMWDSLSNTHNSLTNISNEFKLFKDNVAKQRYDIDTLLCFMERLYSYEHLNDVDEIWNSSELHFSQLSELEKKSDETKSIIEKNKENTDLAIASVVENNDMAIQMLNKKIKYAYLVAGGALGVAIIEMIVIFLKVI